MIERKLIVGRYIMIDFPQARQTPLVGTFSTQIRMPMSIQPSIGFFTRKSEVRPGEGAKAHRNFQWLYWVKGGVNEVAFNNMDVLTGPMSGCWITRYQRLGVEYVGHVGTSESSATNETINAKRAWNEFANAHSDDVIGGFKPRWADNPRPIKGDKDYPKLFGLITRAEYYEVLLYGNKDIARLFRVASIRKIHSAPLRTLQNI